MAVQHFRPVRMTANSLRRPSKQCWPLATKSALCGLLTVCPLLFNVGDACRTLKQASCFVAERTVDGARSRGVDFSKSKETKTNAVQTLNARKFVLRLLSLLPARLQIASSVFSSIADCT